MGSVPPIIATGRRMVAEYMQDEVWIEDRVSLPDGYGGTLVTHERRTTGAQRCRFTRLNDDDARVAAGSTFGDAEAIILFDYAESEALALAEGDIVENVANGERWVLTRRTSPRSNTATIARYGTRQV